MSDLATLQFNVDSRPADRATASLDKLEGSATKAGRASDALAKSQQRAITAMNQLAAASGGTQAYMLKILQAVEANTVAIGALTKAQAEEAAATRAVNNALRDQQAAMAAASRAANENAASVGRHSTAVVQAEGRTRSWAGTLSSLTGTLLGMTAGQFVVESISKAMSEAKRNADFAADATADFNRVMAQAEDAINGVTIATYKLRDARMAAADADLMSRMRANNAQIKELNKKPGLDKIFGQILSGQGPYFARQAELAQIEQLQKENNGLLGESMKLFMAQTPEVEKNTAAHVRRAAAVKASTTAEDQFAKQLEHVLDSLKTPQEKRIEQVREMQQVLKKALDQGKISAEQYRDLIDRMFPPTAQAAKLVTDEIVKTTDALGDVQHEMDAYANDAVRQFHEIANAAEGVTGSVYGIISALKSGNGLAAAGNVMGLVQNLGFAFTAGGTMGGVSALAAAGSQLVGGKAGKVLGAAGLGIGAAMIPGMLVSAGSMGALGALSGGALAAGMAAGPLAPVIGVVVGLAALAKAFQKPSNQGAGYDLITGAFSGKSRTPDTENAVKQAGDAILQIQDALKASGVTVGDTIRGLVIGSRDQSQIYTTGGRTLYSAKGDPTAAVDAAFRAMLDGATYISDIQKQLVESMLAAGKGFDEVAAALQNYAAAQASLQGVDDAILQYTDPKQYALTVLKRNQDARLKSFQDAQAGGLISADQLASVVEKLKQLDALELTDTLSQFGEAVGGAVDAARELAAAQQAAADAVSKAQSAALDAYNRESAALKSTVDQMTQLADSLHAYGAGLVGSSGLLNPRQAYAAARGAFRGLGNDPASLGNLQAVSEAFLNASRAVAPDARSYARDLAAVRARLTEAEVVARDQASIAQKQLDAMTQTASTLGLINSNLLSFADAVQQLINARAVQTAVAGGAANENGRASTNGDFALYVAGNADLLAAYNAYGAARGQTMAQFGEQHWYGGGMNEGRSVVPTFATGGSFDVAGPAFGDRVPVSFMANGGETVAISRADNMARVAEALEAQNDLLRQVLRASEKGAKAVDDMNKTGVWARGASPGEAVETAAA